MSNRNNSGRGKARQEFDEFIDNDSLGANEEDDFSTLDMSETIMPEEHRHILVRQLPLLIQHIYPLLIQMDAAHARPAAPAEGSPRHQGSSSRRASPALTRYDPMIGGEQNSPASPSGRHDPPREGSRDSPELMRRLTSGLSNMDEHERGNTGIPAPAGSRRGVPDTRPPVVIGRETQALIEQARSPAQVTIDKQYMAEQALIVRKGKLGVNEKTSSQRRKGGVGEEMSRADLHRSWAADPKNKTAPAYVPRLRKQHLYPKLRPILGEGMSETT
jgi:hypothetical protein